MRYITPIAIALLASSAAFSVQAADNSSELCSLLDWQDFQSIGVNEETRLINAGWQQGDASKEIPDNKPWFNLCVAQVFSPEGSTYISLSYDGFKGNVSEQQVSDWLTSVAAKDDKKSDVATVKVGNTTCETGKYDLSTKQDDDSITTVVEHFIACDRQVDTRHVSLNIDVPEGRQGSLPNPEQATALLEKSIFRMNVQAFAPPDKLPENTN